MSYKSAYGIEINPEFGKTKKVVCKNKTSYPSETFMTTEESCDKNTWISSALAWPTKDSRKYVNGTLVKTYFMVRRHGVILPALFIKEDKNTGYFRHISNNAKIEDVTEWMIPFFTEN